MENGNKMDGDPAFAEYLHPKLNTSQQAAKASNLRHSKLWGVVLWAVAKVNGA